MNEKSRLTNLLKERAYLSSNPASKKQCEYLAYLVLEAGEGDEVIPDMLSGHKASECIA